MDDAKLGGVLGPLRVERPCSEIWPNLRAVATCMKKSECEFCSWDGAALAAWTG